MPLESIIKKGGRILLLSTLTLLPPLIPSCEPRNDSKEVVEEVSAEEAQNEVEEEKHHYVADKGYLNEAEYQARFEELMTNFKKYQEPISEFNQKEFFDTFDGFVYYYVSYENGEELILKTQDDINKALQNVFSFLKNSPQEELVFLDELQRSLDDFLFRGSFNFNPEVLSSSFVKTYTKELIEFYKTNKNNFNSESSLTFLEIFNKSLYPRRSEARMNFEVDDRTFYEDMITSAIIVFENENKKDIDQTLKMHGFLNDLLTEHNLANETVDKELALKLIASFSSYYSGKIDNVNPNEKLKMAATLKNSFEGLDLTDEECRQVYVSLDGVNFISSLIKDYQYLNFYNKGFLNFLFFADVFFNVDHELFEKVVETFNNSKENALCFSALEDLTGNMNISNANITKVYEKLIKRSINSLKTDFFNLNHYEFFVFHHRILNSIDQFFKEDVKSKKELSFIVADVFSKHEFKVSQEENRAIKRRLLYRVKNYLNSINYDEQELIDLKNALGQNLVDKMIRDYDLFLKNSKQSMKEDRELCFFYAYKEYLGLLSFYSEFYGVKASTIEKLFEDFKQLHQEIKKYDIPHAALMNHLESCVGIFSSSDKLTDFFIEELKQDLSNPFCFSELTTILKTNPSLDQVKKVIDLMFKNESEMMLREIDSYPVLSVISNLPLEERKELYAFMKENYQEIPYDYLIPLNTRQASDEFLETFQKYLRTNSNYLLEFQMYLQGLDFVNIDFNNLAYLIKETDKLANHEYSVIRNAAPEIKKELIALIPRSIGFISEDLETILRTAMDANIYVPTIKYLREISGESLDKVNSDLMNEVVNKLKEDTFLRNPANLQDFFEQINYFPDNIAVQEYRSAYHNPDLLVQSAESIQKFYSNFDAAYESILKSLMDNLAKINNEDSKSVLTEISQDAEESENIRNYAKTKLPQ